MTPVPAATRDAIPAKATLPARSPAAPNAEPAQSPTMRPRSVPAIQTDDEILEIASAPQGSHLENANDCDLGLRSGGEDTPGGDVSNPESSAQDAEPENLRASLDANPELRAAWDEAQAYRETLATPEEARKATALLTYLDRMVRCFSSGGRNIMPNSRAASPASTRWRSPLCLKRWWLGRRGTEAGEVRAVNRSVSTAPRSTVDIPNAPTKFGAEESAVDPVL